MEGNKAAQVQIHVVAVANLLQGPNHGEANAIQQDSCPDGWTSGKQRSADLIANDDDRPLLHIIQVIDPSAFTDRQISDLVEVGAARPRSGRWPDRTR